MCRDGNALPLLSKVQPASGCGNSYLEMLFLPCGRLRHTRTEASNKCGRTRSERDAGNASMGQSQDTEERRKGEI